MRELSIDEMDRSKILRFLLLLELIGFDRCRLAMEIVEWKKSRMVSDFRLEPSYF